MWHFINRLFSVCQDVFMVLLDIYGIIFCIHFILNNCTHIVAFTKNAIA